MEEISPVKNILKERASPPPLSESFFQFVKEDNLLEFLEKKFAKSNDRNFNRLKIVLLGLHNELEGVFNFTLCHLFLNKYLSEEKMQFFEDEILAKITFDEKISILRKQKFLTDSLCKKARDINILRNRCMHKTYKDPIYGGRNAKKDKTIILNVLDDHLNIYKHITDILFHPNEPIKNLKVK